VTGALVGAVVIGGVALGFLYKSASDQGRSLEGADGKTAAIAGGIGAGAGALVAWAVR